MCQAEAGPLDNLGHDTGAESDSFFSRRLRREEGDRVMAVFLVG